MCCVHDRLQYFENTGGSTQPRFEKAATGNADPVKGLAFDKWASWAFAVSLPNSHWLGKWIPDPEPYPTCRLP